VLFLSNRDIIVRSMKFGQSVEFHKGVAREVPKLLQNECIEKGILPVDEKGKILDIDAIPAPNTDVKKIPMAPSDPDVLYGEVLEVIKALVEENNSKNFTGGNRPAADAVSRSLGYKVDQKTVNQVWEANRQKILQQKQGSTAIVPESR